MPLPTGGLIARSAANRASRISRIGVLTLIGCGFSAASTSAAAQNYGAFDDGFTAFVDNGAALASPDIAIGSGHIVAVASGELAWYGRNQQLLGSVPLGGDTGLWDSISSPSDMADVQAVWNQNSERFFVAGLGRADDGNNYIFVAISNSSNPSDGWIVRKTPSSELKHFSLGVYDTGIYAGFDYVAPIGSWYIHNSLEELLNPGWLHFFGGQVSSSTQSFAANDSSGTDDQRMILASADPTRLDKIRLKGRDLVWSNGPNLVTWLNVPQQTSPPLIPQLNGPPISESMDFRSAKVSNDTCWLAQTVGNGDHAIVRWYEIDLNGWPGSGQVPAIDQTGDIDLGPGVHAYLPDIAVDNEGNAAIVFSISSANDPITIARAIRLADDAPGTFRPHYEVLSSTNAVTSGAWGAYVGIEADPVLPGVFWSHAPYNTAEGWKTYISKITLADDVPPSDGPRLNTPGNGFIHNIIPALQWDFNDLASGFRIHVSRSPNFSQLEYSSGVIVGNSHQIPDGVLECNTRYYWRVIAETSHGDMMSDPESRWFERRMVQDLNLDGIVDAADLGMFLTVYNTTEPLADFNSDGIVNSADLGSLIGSFGQICN